MSSNWFKETRKKHMEQERRKGMYFWQQQQKKKGLTLPYKGICPLHSSMEHEIKIARKEIRHINQQIAELRSKLENLTEVIHQLKLKAQPA